MALRRLPSLREPGLLLSGVAHVALIVAGLVVVSDVAELPSVEEGIAVEMITESQFSEITRGERDAAEVQPVPAPRAERVADEQELRPAGEDARDTQTPATRPADMEVADRPVAAASEPPPPPPPPPAPPVPTPVAEPAPVPPAPPPPPDPAPPTPAAPAPVVADAPAPVPPPLPPSRAARQQAQAEAARRVAAEAERRRVAEAESREREARERADTARLAEARRRDDEEARASRVAEEADRFDPSDIASILRSTEEAASTGAAAAQINRTASLGTDTGTAPRLNPSMRDQLVGLITAQLRACWDVPIAAQAMQNPPVAAVRMALGQDGSLVTEPQVTNTSPDPLFRSVADSALRATRRCAPLQIPAQFAPYYEDWRNLTVNFNPLFS